MKVSTNRDNSANLSELKTYSWIKSKTSEAGDSRENFLLESRVCSATDRLLAEKGYELKASGQTDFLVTYHAAVEKKIKMSTVNRSHGYDPAFNWDYRRGREVAGNVPTQTTAREYEQGTLILDIVDGTTRKLMWRGTAQAEINRADGAAKKEKRINEAVRRMLDQFPSA